MVVLFGPEGFEPGDFSAWGEYATRGVVSIVQMPHTGVYAAQAGPVDALLMAWWAHTLLTPVDTAYMRCYVLFPSLPVSTVTIDGSVLRLSDINSASYAQAGLAIDPTGKTYWRLRVPSGVYVVEATIIPNRWYVMELRRLASTGIATLYIDEVPVLNRTAETFVGPTAYVYGGLLDADLGLIAICDDFIVADNYIGPIGTPTTVRLSFTSNAPVNATINGASIPSGSYVNFAPNTQVALSVPLSIQGYVFDHWEIGPLWTTVNSLTMSITENLTALAVYTVPVKHVLSVNTNISGATFTVKGVNTMSYVTPFSGSLDEGIYEITMPASIMVGANNYNFQSWEDGSISPLRIVPLLADTSLYATYALGLPPKPGFNRMWLIPLGFVSVAGIALLGGPEKKKRKKKQA